MGDIEGTKEVVCSAGNGNKIIYKNNEKLQIFEIPSTYATISITFEDQMDEFSIHLLEQLNDTTGKIISDEEKLKEIKIRKSGINYRFVKDAPKLVYTDVTETEMFGFPEIKKSVLTAVDNGLWANHGIRKLKLCMLHLAEEDDEWEIRTLLYFNKIDNDDIPPIFMETDKLNRDPIGEKKSYETFAYINTNQLGIKIDNSKQRALFSGYFEISFAIDNISINDVKYCFPIELLLNNTVYQPGKKTCVPLQKNTVSIDFGTSSSCVAVRGENGIELLTLSARKDGRNDINIYENPTCIMIYRWEQIYDQWRKENPDFPLILKGNLEEEELGEKEVQFDFGYSVKDCLNRVSDKELNSIISEIKMIPKMIQREEQLSVRPLVIQNKKRIDLVDSYEEQNDESLDAVAFYGYILGKAINRVEKNRLYMKYQITYPVKFNETVKRKLCRSLEYGLKRSLPLTLRDAVDVNQRPALKVEAKYPEPVAYIGSICGKYLKLEKEKSEAKLFAVYDFGGGTLDYSFGIFASDKDEPDSSCIHILGVDGDSNIGGELLIRKMSYWVYTSPTNMLQFIEKKVPFEKPDGEVLPDDDRLGELFNRSASAKSNVRKMNERITRYIFEGKNALDGNYEEETENEFMNSSALQKLNVELIEFMDLDDEVIDIDVSYDLKEINEQLEKILYQTVLAFKASMERAFKNRKTVLNECGINKFDMKDVHIFKAGNSSRNRILGRIMEKEFPDNEILLVDETSDEFMSNVANGDMLLSRSRQVAITPKTAVALGQLRLSDFYVDNTNIMDGHPFNWYVGMINGARNEFVIIIDKVNLNENWVKYGRIHSMDMRIYYTDAYIEDADDMKLKTVEIDEYLEEESMGKYLYLRIKDSDTISCCICDKKAQQEELEEEFEVLLQ